MKFLLPLFLLYASALAAEEGPDFAEQTAASEKIARQYYEYYIDLEFDKMAPLLAENASFFDPTAKDIFGGEKHTGKAAVLANFRSAFASITEMEIRQSQAFFSGSYGVFHGLLTWHFKSGAEERIAAIENMPLTVIIKVEDGKIVEHRDYADYRVFVEQFAAQQEKDDGEK